MFIYLYKRFRRDLWEGVVAKASTACAGPRGGGGGGVLSFFTSYVGSGPASIVHSQKISGISSTSKIFEILATPKNSPHSVPKLPRIIVQFCDDPPPPPNIHKIPQKNIHFSENLNNY